MLPRDCDTANVAGGAKMPVPEAETVSASAEAHWPVVTGDAPARIVSVVVVVVVVVVVFAFTGNTVS
jgi:hypothetical protein